MPFSALSGIVSEPSCEEPGVGIVMMCVGASPTSMLSVIAPLSRSIRLIHFPNQLLL